MVGLTRKPCRSSTTYWTRTVTRRALLLCGGSHHIPESGLPVDSRGLFGGLVCPPGARDVEKQYPKKSADPARPPHAVGDGTGWSTWRHAQPLACTASARAKSNATANTYAAWPAVVSCDVPTRRAPWMINRSASACSLHCKVRSHRHIEISRFRWIGQVIPYVRV